MAENVLDVELSGAPGAFLTIEVIGRAQDDTELSVATHQVGQQGGDFELPGLATLRVPANAISGTVEIASLDSPLMRLLANDLDDSITVLDFPAIRLTTAGPVDDRVDLVLDMPTLPAVLPTGVEVLFLVLSRTFGANAEVIDELTPVGSFLCPATNACATLSPSWFLPDDANPNGRVIQVAVAYATTSPAQANALLADASIVSDILRNAQAVAAEGTLSLWEVDPTSPPNNAEVNRGEEIDFRATFLLDPDFEFVSPFAPSFVPFREGCQVRHGPDLCFTSRFFRANGALHNAVDLRTQLRAGGPGEQEVFAVASGFVGKVKEIRASDTGVAVWVQHDPAFGAIRARKGGPGLITAYLHLKPGVLVGPGDVVLGYPNPLAVSDSTGEGITGPHLHIQASLDRKRLDPEPLLAGNPALFLRPASGLLPFLALSHS